MGKIVIEEDYRNIEWGEDYPCKGPAIPKEAADAYFKALNLYCKLFTGEDHEHWFTIIDGDTVEIIPASRYKVEK